MKNTTINEARRILDTHSLKEVAIRIGYKSAGTLYSIRSGKIAIGEKLALRIVEAYRGKELAVKPESTRPPKKPEVQKPKGDREEKQVGQWRSAADVIFDHGAEDLEPKMEKMAREIMERVMKGEAFPAIVKRVVEIVHEELEKVAEAKIKEPEARRKTPPIKFPDIDNPEEFKERLEKMPDLVASVTVLNGEPSGYCPSDLPGRGRNALKDPQKRRFWRRKL